VHSINAHLIGRPASGVVILSPSTAPAAGTTVAAEAPSLLAAQHIISSVERAARLALFV
jgi:hypothetical protein